MISAVILAKNTEKEINSCLKSLDWVDELIVIDDYSVDRTKEKAKDAGARVFKRKLNDNFGEQRNFGLAKASHNWVFFLDADEVVSLELRDEIKKIFAVDNKPAGYKFKRQETLLNKKLKYGEAGANSFVRLANKKAGRWQGAVHEVWRIKGKTKTLKNPIIHNRKITITEFTDRINFYSSLRAGELYKRKVRTNGLLIILYPAAKFLQNYFLRLGFLDGKAGLIFALMMSFHSFLVRSKLYLLWKNKGVEEPPIPALKTLYEKYG